jgi:hypothetical protein
MALAKLFAKINDFSHIWEYELIEDFEFPYDEEELIVVPKYFSYDGASIPSFAWIAIYTPFDPIVMLPALIHDWLYGTHQVEREDADRALLSLLLSNGVPHAKADAIYRAVRYFGGAAWENTEDDLNYFRWLRQRLIDEGIDVAKYHFPPELDLYEEHFLRRGRSGNQAFTFRFGMRKRSAKEDFLARTSNFPVILEAYRQLEMPVNDRSPIHGPIERSHKWRNLKWSWNHIDSQWSFGRLTAERCDGRPSNVEKNLDIWVRNISEFCPWDSYIKLDEAERFTEKQVPKRPRQRYSSGNPHSSRAF